VQSKLSQQKAHHVRTRLKSEALLTGRLFDDRGNRMSPTHAKKRGIKYRYYVSSPLFQGQASDAGSIHRVPATEVEARVLAAVRKHFNPAAPMDDGELIRTYVARVEIKRDELVVHPSGVSSNGHQTKTGKVLRIPWRKPPFKKRREILLSNRADSRPIRSETRATLVASIARGRRWLEELMADPTASTDSIAAREQCSTRKVNMTISLAFLSPVLVKAAVDGALPHGIGVARLVDLPAAWSRQCQMHGLCVSKSVAAGPAHL
jgi:hypothetical protein